MSITPVVTAGPARTGSTAVVGRFLRKGEPVVVNGVRLVVREVLDSASQDVTWLVCDDNERQQVHVRTGRGQFVELYDADAPDLARLLRGMGIR